MPNKDRVLCLLQILRKETDDETWLATEEIRDRLKAEGVNAPSALCVRISKPFATAV